MIENPETAAFLVDWFSQHGMTPVPLQRFEPGNKNSKRPLLGNWTIQECPRDVALQYAAAGHSLGARLSDEILVVDVDVREDGDGTGGWQYLSHQAGLNQIRTLTAWSDHGGLHAYYRIPRTKVQRNIPECGKRVEFLTYGAQVVMPGNCHWKGGIYNAHFEQIYDGSLQIAEAPESLLAMVRKPERNHGTSNSFNLDASDIEKCLSMLDVEEYRGTGGGAWRDLMFAVHHACSGSDDGLQAFLSWCLSDSEYSDHEEMICARWASCNATGEGHITAGTLLKACREAAVRSPDAREQWLSELAAIQARHAFEHIPESTAPASPMPAKCRVRVDSELSRVADDCESLLEDCEDIYVHNGNLVRLRGSQCVDGTYSDVTIQELNKDSLSDELSKRARFYKTSRSRNAPTEVPERIVKILLQRAGSSRIRTLRGLYKAPTFLPNGGVLQSPGFNALFELFYGPQRFYPCVPRQPSRDDALRALDVLREPLVDFPFLNEAHRSVALSNMLTLAARPVFLHAESRSIPLTVHDGNQAGVGKTLLADVISRAMTGSPATTMNCPNDDTEMSKRLTTLALEAPAVSVIDNVPNGKDLNFPSVDQVITTGELYSRLLGTNKSTGRLPWTTLLILTGNNLRLNPSSDTSRRANYCRLDFLGETPHARANLTHGNEAKLVAFVMENHPRLLTAALTILRAYAAAGSPEVSAEPWHSFSTWSTVARDPLIWLGVPDPYIARDDMGDFDESSSDLKRLLDALEFFFGNEGWKSNDLITRFNQPATTVGVDSRSESIGTEIDTREVLQELLFANFNGRTKSISSMLKNYKLKTQAGRRLIYCSSSRLWRVVKL